MSSKKNKRTTGMIYYLPAVKGPYGAGVLGDEKMKEIFDWAAKAKMTVVQFTPHGPTTISNSPYQSPSGFAGNPYFVNPQRLLKDELISQEIHDEEFCLPDGDQIPYEDLFNTREKALRQAYDVFKAKEGLDDETYRDFCRTHSDWLEDYALYAAIKIQQEFAPFYQWDAKLRRRDPQELAKFKEAHDDDINFQRFIQFRFWGDVQETVRYAKERGISIYADLPFYVSLDSADVWTHPELFQVRYDDNHNLHIVQEGGAKEDDVRDVVRGWGNPAYNWENHRQTNYDWFRRRVRLIGKYFDGMRFDYVVGLYQYVGVQRDENGNITGQYYPGGAFLEPSVTATLNQEAKEHNLTIVGEDVGRITPEHRAHMKSLGWYGMRVLQYAFSERNKADNRHLPFNYDFGDVAFIGNHDNRSALCFLTECPEISRQAAQLWTNETEPEAIFKRFVFSLYASTAEQVYLSLPDLIQANVEAFNKTWCWKMPTEMLRNEYADLLANLAVYSNRAPSERDDYLNATNALLKDANK